MQSGTTGINTIRIYNPIKQGQDHDPTGDFIRQWLPELAAVHAVHLHEPWLMEEVTQQRVGCVLGIDYPLPVVEPAAAAREARERIWGLRQELGFRELAQSIHQQHGSRRSNQAPRSRKRRGRSSPGSSTVQQLDLDLS